MRGRKLGWSHHGLWRIVCQVVAFVLYAGASLMEVAACGNLASAREYLRLLRAVRLPNRQVFRYEPRDYRTCDPVTDDEVWQAIWSIPRHSSSQTYYVNAAIGNDGNDGKLDVSGRAWATLSHASAQSFNPGDMLVIDGSCNASDVLTFPNSGTQLSRITISGVNGATINCGSSNGIYLHGVEFITVQNLTVTGAGAGSFGAANLNPNGGTPGYNPLSLQYGVLLYDNRTSGSKLRSVYVNSVTVTGCQEAIGLQTPNNGQVVVGHVDVRFTNLTLHDCQHSGILANGGHGDVDGWYDTGVGVPHDQGTFLGIFLGDSSIYNITGANLSGMTGSCGFNINNATSVLAERVIIHDVAYNDGSNDNNTAGLFIYHGVKNGVMRFCEGYNNRTQQGGDGICYDLDNGTTNCTVELSYSHDNAGQAFNSQGSGSVFRYCVSRNDNKANANGVILDAGGVAQQGIYHNLTIYLGSTTAAGACIAAQAQNATQFYNNVFVVTGARRINNTGNTPIFVGNCYYESTGGTVNYTGAITAFSGAGSWQAAGYEALNGINYGVQGNPLLSNPTAGAGAGYVVPGSILLQSLPYFDLGSGSPAIGLGIPLEIAGIVAGSIDFHGYPNRNSSGNVDAGAMAYGASLLAPNSGIPGVWMFTST